MITALWKKYNKEKKEELLKIFAITKSPGYAVKVNTQ